jgi:hypothetical protein
MAVQQMAMRDNDRPRPTLHHAAVTSKIDSLTSASLGTAIAGIAPWVLGIDPDCPTQGPSGFLLHVLAGVRGGKTRRLRPRSPAYSKDHNRQGRLTKQHISRLRNWNGNWGTDGGEDFPRADFNRVQFGCAGRQQDATGKGER